jgi:hypothetical protein
MKELIPIVMLHAAGNVGGNVAFGAGALVSRKDSTPGFI